MVIVRLQGGLGNQMFQYAVGYIISRKHNNNLKLDLTFLLDRSIRDIVYKNYELDAFEIYPRFTLLSHILKITHIPFFIFAIDYLFYNKIIPKLRIIKYFKENLPGFYEDILLTKSKHVYLDGYWQSEKYFKGFEKEIKNIFTFRYKFSDNAKKVYNEIIHTNSVCISVRRGEYVTNPKFAKIHGFIGLDYYSKAIEYIERNIKNPRFFITSDDIEWCKENLGPLLSNYRHIFFDKKVDFGYKGLKYWQYLHLMTGCKSFIISNSSFAWWGAWLGEKKDSIVIAPKKWFADYEYNKSAGDIIPDRWIKL